MKGILKTLLAVLAITNAGAVFGQEPPPGGGEGGGSMGNDWDVDIVVDGEDTDEIYRYDMYGNVEHLVVTVRWGSGTTTTMLWPSMQVIPSPMTRDATNATYESRTVKSTSAGTITIKVQYTGQGPIPNQVPINVRNIVMLRAAPGFLNEDAQNGLESPVVYSFHGGSEIAETPEKALRIVDLNASGYGEMMLQVLSECSVTGANGVNCNASGNNPTALKDNRKVQISEFMGGASFFEPGASAVDTKTYPSTPFVEGVSPTWSYVKFEKKAVVEEHGTAFTNRATWRVGLQPTKMYNGYGTIQPLETFGAYSAYSFFPDYDLFGWHGNYTWNAVPNGSFNAGASGSLSSQSIDIRSFDTSVFHPVFLYDSRSVPHRPQFEDFLLSTFMYDVGDHRQASYQVTFADGLVGKSVRNIQMYLTAHDSYELDTRKFWEITYARYPMLSDESINGWIKAGDFSAEFWIDPQYQYLPVFNGMLKTGGEALLGLINNPALNVVLSAAYGGFEAMLDDTLQSKLVSLPFRSSIGGEVVLLERIGGSEADLEANPELYEWRVEAIPAKFVTPAVNQKYGPNGFEGTDFRFQERDQLHHLSKKKYVLRRILVEA